MASKTGKNSDAISECVEYKINFRKIGEYIQMVYQIGKPAGVTFTDLLVKVQAFGLFKYIDLIVWVDYTNNINNVKL